MFAILLTTLLALISCVSSAPEEGFQGKVEVSRQLIAAGDHRTAIGFLVPLAKQWPQSAEVTYLMGMAYLGLGSLEPSYKAFEKTLAIQPNNWDALLNIAYVSIVRKKFAQSRKYLDRILKGNDYPYLEKVHVNYGLSYMEEGNCQLALNYFRRSIALDPTLVVAHYNMGTCSRRLGDTQGAVNSFEKAVDFCPNCADPQMELVKSYAHLGQSKKALGIVQNMLRYKLDKKTKRWAENMMLSLKK